MFSNCHLKTWKNRGGAAPPAPARRRRSSPSPTGSFSPFLPEQERGPPEAWTHFNGATGNNRATGQIALPEECLPPGPWQSPSTGFAGPPPGRGGLAAPTDAEPGSGRTGNPSPTGSEPGICYRFCRRQIHFRFADGNLQNTFTSQFSTLNSQFQRDGRPVNGGLGSTHEGHRRPPDN